jgi:oligoendopeptidase F
LSTAEITWNLSEICPCITDPKINEMIDQVITSAGVFEKKYRGKLIQLKPDELSGCFRDIEAFDLQFSDVTLYSSLCYSANMTSPEAQALHDRVSKLEANISKQLAFFTLELGKLVKNNPEIIQNSCVANYRHMLERIHRRVEHQLSEVEEQLIIEKDQFGVNAWEELQSKWLNTRLFEVIVCGEKKTLNYGTASGLLSHPDQSTRESANRSIYGLLGKDGEIFASALRSICNDWVSVSKRRKYNSPLESSLLNNDTEQTIIDNLLQTIEKSTTIYQRYLKQKAKLMNLPILGNHDIIAPLPNLPEQKFTFHQAQDLILEAYNKFNTQYATAAEEMFEKCHIDASPRFGKRNGAFCASYYRGKTAYILQSFNGTLSDIFTLAHELGHATHDWYASKNQTLLNTHMPSITAETASIFGELLLTDLLLSRAKSDDERKALLCLVLDEAGMTAFQVTARVWFEQALYSSIEKEEFLNYQTICSHWVNARNRIYGDSVTWFPEMEAEWTIKPHYYMANYRFYNYPYVYAQMFVYSLYEQYLSEGKGFVPKMAAALSAGSAISPKDIAKTMGLDVEKPDFWVGGMKVFEHFVNGLKAI